MPILMHKYIYRFICVLFLEKHYTYKNIYVPLNLFAQANKTNFINDFLECVAWQVRKKHTQRTFRS